MNLDTVPNDLHILVTRLQNIGDVLTFIPALRTLRQALPRATITFLGKHAGGLDIMRNCPYIDDTLVVRGRGWREKLRLVRELRRRRIDYFIISPQDLGRVPLAWLGGARHIVGYPCFYNYGRRQREKLPGLLDIAPKHDRSLTEVENCLRLVQDVLDDIGVPMPVEASTRLEYTWETSDDTARAAHLLAAKGISAGDYVVAAAPFSKRPAKNWPAARFVELFRQLCAAWRCRVLLLGGTAERALTDEVCAGVGPACTTCAGETTLGQSAVLLRRAQLFVGPDSGPAFLATAVGTPVVALYGPADFYRWRPPQNDVPRINIVHPLPCNPCRHQVCPLTPSCMERISVAEVVAACCRITEKAA